MNAASLSYSSRQWEWILTDMAPLSCTIRFHEGSQITSKHVVE